MKLIDCSTAETALASVADMLGVSPEELRARARSIPQGEYFDADLCSRVMLDGFECPPGLTARYFHGSRVLDPGTFRTDGILTWSIMRPRMLQQLGELAAGIEKRGEDPNAGSVAAKLWFPKDLEGPYAFLVRRTAVDAPGCVHSYHGMPEGIEDAAGHLVGANCHELVERFRAMSRPCIVHFRAPATTRTLDSAACFVALCELHGEADAAHVITGGYCGRGTPVPPEDVLHVELL